jgi:ribokinase
MNIAVIGSINMDYISKVNNLPKKGETLTASAFHLAGGGKGANQAVAASKLGANVNMIGAVGDDINGKELVRVLRESGVNVSGITFVFEPTGNALIFVEDSGSNMIVVYPGANGKVDINMVKEKLDYIKKSEIVILQHEIPMETVFITAKLAKDLGKKVILNPAPAKELPKEIFQYIDYITPNETELFILTGTEDYKKGSKILKELGAKNVVVTLGDKGCYYLGEDGEAFVESFKVMAVDSTAAGDTFNGALAIALIEGKPLMEALRFANAAGAVTTTKLGAQTSLPTREEVEALMK